MITVRTRVPRRARLPELRADAAPAIAVRAALHECLEHMAANVAGAAAGRDPEYLHQLRVGMRRLRATLRASRDLWHKKTLRALRRALRPLRAASAAVRDLDVVMDLLPPASRPAARVQRAAAQARLAALLDALPRWRLPRAAARRQTPLPEFARKALSRLDRKARRRGARTDWSDAEARHALRSRLRRLRYASEFLQGAFPLRDAAPLIQSLKALQDLLGELNDIVVARRLAGEISRPPHKATTRERALLARLPAAWRRYAVAPRFWQPKRA